MAKRSAEELEEYIIDVFLTHGQFTYEGKTYRVVKAGKPRPTEGGGECKTDVYVLGECDGEDFELKLSVKKESAEFPENKFTPERAESVFGQDWQAIIERMARSIAHRFEGEYLFHVDKRGNKIQANSINLGWRIEGANKERNLSVKVDLTDQEIKDSLYRGINLPPVKRNAYIMWEGKKEIIDDSGVADWIIETEAEQIQSPQDVINQMINIDDYELKNPTYLAFMADNYRTDVEKFENRWIAVRVVYDVVDGKLTHTFDYNKPFTYKAKDLVPDLKEKLAELGKFHPSDMDIENDFADPSKVYKKKR